MSAQAIHDSSDDVDLKAVAGRLVRGAGWIAASALTCAVVAFISTFAMRELYLSDTLLAPTPELGQPSSDLSALAGRFGNLASLAGIELDSQEVDTKTIAIEMLRSRGFAKLFVERHKLAGILLAGKGWDRAGNRVLIDTAEYDAARDVWPNRLKKGDTPRPSAKEIHEAYSDAVEVIEDYRTGLVQIRVRTVSPEVSRSVAEALVADINAELRARAVQESRRTVKYLRDQIEQTDLAELQRVFFRLTENEMRKAMMAEVRKDFAFTVVDPPVASEKRESPRRLLIALAGAIVGALLAAAAVMTGAVKPMRWQRSRAA